MTTVGELDVDRFSRTGRVDLLVALERAKAHLDAQQQLVLARMAVDPQYEPVENQEHNFVAEEAATALRLAGRTAADRIAVAEQIVTRLPRTLALLMAGTIALAHARVIVNATIGRSDAETTQIETAALARAGTRTRAEMSRAVDRVCTRPDAARPANQPGPPPAEDDRYVMIRPSSQVGLAELIALLPATAKTFRVSAVGTITYGMTRNGPSFATPRTATPPGPAPPAASTPNPPTNSPSTPPSATPPPATPPSATPPSRHPTTTRRRSRPLTARVRPGRRRPLGPGRACAR